MSTKCSGCGRPIQSLEFLECFACQETYDLLCLGMEAATFNNLKQETRDCWLCPLCTSSRPKVDNTHTPIGSPAGPLNSTYNTLDRANTTLDRVNHLRGNRRQVATPSLFCGPESEISQLIDEIKQLREEMHDVKESSKEIALLRQDVHSLKDQLSTIPMTVASYENKITAQEVEIAQLKESLSDLQTLLNIREQDGLGNKLEIAGVPEADSENLQHAVLITATRLGVELTAADIDCVMRAGPKRPVKTSSKEWMPRPIVVKLLRRSKRDEILHSAKTRRNITSDIIVQGTAQKLYVNEKLAKANRALFKVARARAQQHNFRNCWTRNGAIYVRQAEKKPAVHIQSYADLTERSRDLHETRLFFNARLLLLLKWGKTAEVGGELPAGSLQVSPSTLSFGRVALAVPHTATVTITNTGNSTLHLASVAGTTPDFHASFFHSKTLPPNGNTSFSVVYLGRQEGLVSAQLYIHTSQGAHIYQVSAVGVASDWGVWPIIGLRVPYNSTVDPILTMYNPTDDTVQVTEIYSSAAWLTLQLPGGGGSAPRSAWLLRPRARADLVQLVVRPPDTHARLAYVRVKVNVSSAWFVLSVEARAAEAGEWVEPAAVRAGVRGAYDAPAVWTMRLANSAPHAVPAPLTCRARCLPHPHQPPPPAPAPPTPQHTHTANGESNGWMTEGVECTLEREIIPAHAHVDAALKLHYHKLWEQYMSIGRDNGREDDKEEAWCAGWVRVGRAVMPFTVRLVEGSLLLQPEHMSFGVGARGGYEHAGEWRTVIAHNRFPRALRLLRIDYPLHLDHYLEISPMVGMSLLPGESKRVLLARIRPDTPPHPTPLHLEPAHITLVTDLAEYTLPVSIYSATMYLEWEWPTWREKSLQLGTVEAGRMVRVRARLHNPAPTPIALSELYLAAALPRAAFFIEREGGDEIAGGGWRYCRLEVRAPSHRHWYSEVSGAVWVRAPAATTVVHVTMRGEQGAVRMRVVPDVLSYAPHVSSKSEVVVESSMRSSMQLLNVTLVDRTDSSGFVFTASKRVIAQGVHSLGLLHSPEVEGWEELCRSHCYSGLSPESPEWTAWVRRSYAYDESAAQADATLLSARRAIYARAQNYTLHLEVVTSHVRRLRAALRVIATWPRLHVTHAGVTHAGLVAVGTTRQLYVHVRNPSTRPLIVHALLPTHATSTRGMLPLEECRPMFFTQVKCSVDGEAFSLKEWRRVRGNTSEWSELSEQVEGGNATLLMLPPDAEIQLRIEYTPSAPTHSTHTLYIRNNLTVIEVVPLSGSGGTAQLAFTHSEPLHLVVQECIGSGEADGVAARTVYLRNTGTVQVRVHTWHVCGRVAHVQDEENTCGARGFSLRPCTPLELRPNATRRLRIAYRADGTLLRDGCTITAITDHGWYEWSVWGVVTAREPWRCEMTSEGWWSGTSVRTLAVGGAAVALALALVLGALDAERLLLRARLARARTTGREGRTLDLPRLATLHDSMRTATPDTPPTLINRRRKSCRRSTPALAPADPQAERRAFEQWRAGVTRQECDPRETGVQGGEPKPASALEQESSDSSTSSAERRVHETNEHSSPTTDTDSDTEHEQQPVSEERDPEEVDDPLLTHSHTEQTEDDAEVLEPVVSSSLPMNSERRPSTEEQKAVQGDCDVSQETVVPSGGVTPSHLEEVSTRYMPLRPERQRTREPFDHKEIRRPVKMQSRREKPLKRRERVTITSARTTSSTPAPPATTVSSSTSTSSSASAPGIRWGASWSSVVASKDNRVPDQPLPPIGSNVRRLADQQPPPLGPSPPPAEQSLFYFNSAGVGGGAADVRHAALSPLTWSHTPYTQYQETCNISGAPSTGDASSASTSAGYGSIGSLWSTPSQSSAPGTVWTWGAPVRPPPGFPPNPTATHRPPAPSDPQPVRTFDPFHSLSSIWSPGALDWRRDDDQLH